MLTMTSKRADNDKISMFLYSTKCIQGICWVLYVQATYFQSYVMVHSDQPMPVAAILKNGRQIQVFRRTSGRQVDSGRGPPRLLGAHCLPSPPQGATWSTDGWRSISKCSRSEHRAFWASQMNLGRNKKTKIRLIRLIGVVFSNGTTLSDISELINERTLYWQRVRHFAMSKSDWFTA